MHFFRIVRIMCSEPKHTISHPHIIPVDLLEDKAGITICKLWFIMKNAGNIISEEEQGLKAQLAIS